MSFKDYLENLDEGSFAKGYWLTLSGKGGELDSAFAAKKSDFKKILMNWASTLEDGDVIRVKKGESER